MRNLKRALSLGLTATMISGLMVMGSSAASYADVTSEQNQEAIEVLKAVGIMVGDEKGNFNPEAKVTRNEMAVVMSNLMAYNVASYKNTSPFTDVPEWAEPYVAACYTNGITSGYDAKTYGGSDSVTTAQAALMVMKALGYFQYQSDFGADWQLSTVAQGNKIDLFDDVDSGVKEAMTRNDVAQLVLNALEAGTVEAEKNGQDIKVGDITITSGKVTYKYRHQRQGLCQGHQRQASPPPPTASMASPAPSWSWARSCTQGDLTKARRAMTTSAVPPPSGSIRPRRSAPSPRRPTTSSPPSVTSKELYDEVGKTATDSYKCDWRLGGRRDREVRRRQPERQPNDDDKDFSAKDRRGRSDRQRRGHRGLCGRHRRRETVDVAVINQYAAEVLKVDEDDKTITLSDLDNGPAQTSDTFDTDDFAEDDIVIYSYADGEIQDVYAAEKLEGEVTRVRSNTEDGETATATTSSWTAPPISTTPLFPAPTA